MGWIGTITASAGTLLALGGGIAGAIATTAGLVTLGSCIGVQLGGNLGKAIGGIFGKTAAKWGERVGVVVGGLAGTGAAVTVGVGLGMSGGWWAAGAAAVTIPLVSKAFSWLGARNDAKKAAAEAAKMQAAQTPPTKPAADSAQPAA